MAIFPEKGIFKKIILQKQILKIWPFFQKRVFSKRGIFQTDILNLFFKKGVFLNWGYFSKGGVL